MKILSLNGRAYVDHNGTTNYTNYGVKVIDFGDYICTGNKVHKKSFFDNIDYDKQVIFIDKSRIDFS